MIIGTGPLGRATAMDFACGKGRRRVVGFLSWPDDRPARVLGAPLLGSADELAAHLAQHDIAEVYLAAAPQHHGDALESAVHTCERMAVGFAVPAVPFRLTRGRPRGTRGFPDGYIHFAMPSPSRVAPVAHALRNLAAHAATLWILAPLLMLMRLATLITHSQRVTPHPGEVQSSLPSPLPRPLGALLGKGQLGRVVHSLDSARRVRSA